MNELLKKIIHYICYAYPSDLSRTVLVKLVYLADVEFTKVNGRRMTTVNYRYDNYGPFSWEIIDTAQELIDIGVIGMEPTITEFGDEKYKYEATVKPKIEGLDEITRRILKETVAKFSRYSFAGLIDYVYTTPPLTCFNKGEMIDIEKALGGFEMSTTDRINARRAIDAVKARIKAKDRAGLTPREFNGFDVAHLKMQRENADAQMRMLKRKRAAS